MSEITLTLPDDAAQVLRVTPENVGEELRIAAAMKLLEMGRISSGKAAELAGIPRVVFLTRMADYGVPAFDYSEEELRAEAGIE